MTHPVFAPEYTYIAVLGIVFGFIMAFAIGANDVANAFGSSVGAGSLTLGWAIILGSIFEFLGSLLLGAKVASTIRGKVLITSYYTNSPEILMFGDLCSLIIASTWLLVATALELPVSTTHSIIAAIIGFGIVAHGFESVDWNTTKDIFISWVAAPILAGIMSSIFFKALLELVLKSEHIFDRALNVYPLVIFVAITINLFFLLFNADNNIHIENYGHVVVLPASLGGGAVCAVLTRFCIVPMIRTRVHREHNEHMAASMEARTNNQDDVEDPSNDDDSESMEYDDRMESEEVEKAEKSTLVATSREKKDEVAESPVVDEEDTKGEEEEEEVHHQSPQQQQELQHSKNIAVAAWDALAERTFRQDLKSKSLHENKRAAEIWDVAFEFDQKTERLFSYLQIFTACLASFAHGANDVANAIAPISGILYIYEHGELVTTSPVQKWILALGGAGIAAGFTLYGYKIIKAVGFKLTCISPARGFCIELAASLAVVTAAFIRIPVSTTQCLVGATCGVGIASGGLGSVQWLFLLRVCMGWASIFLISAVVSAGFFAFCVYSPTL